MCRERTSWKVACECSAPESRNVGQDQTQMVHRAMSGNDDDEVVVNRIVWKLTN